MVMDTLIQHNPFSGQRLDENTGRTTGAIHDFVGTFETSVVTSDVLSENLSKIHVRRVAPKQIEVACDNVLLKVNEIHDKDAGTGTGYWLSSYVMLPWLIASKNSFQGKHVLELGSGGGLVGIALASSAFDVASVTITDHIDLLVDLAAENAKQNESSLIVTPNVTNLDWENDEEVLQVDVIVASDCVFRSTAQSFVKAVFRHLKPGGELYIVNAPERSSRPGVDQMIYALRERGFVELVPTQIIMSRDERLERVDHNGISADEIAQGLDQLTATHHHKELWVIKMTGFDTPDPDSE